MLFMPQKKGTPLPNHYLKGEMLRYRKFDFQNTDLKSEEKLWYIQAIKTKHRNNW